MSKATVKLPEVASRIFELLEPLESVDRHKVIQSAAALLGEHLQLGEKAAPQGVFTAQSGLAIGPKARRWMQQNGITDEALEEVFHLNGGNAEVIASDVPGSSRVAKSKNCYLLTGTQALLSTDNPSFQDKDAVALCQHMRCYDSANNASMRKQIGLSGSKQSGFTLTAPCLREAAELVKQMSTKKQ